MASFYHPWVGGAMKCNFICVLTLQRLKGDFPGAQRLVWQKGGNLEESECNPDGGSGVGRTPSQYPLAKVECPPEV